MCTLPPIVRNWTWGVQKTSHAYYGGHLPSTVHIVQRVYHTALTELFYNGGAKTFSEYFTESFRIDQELNILFIPVSFATFWPHWMSRIHVWSLCLCSGIVSVKSRCLALLDALKKMKRWPATKAIKRSTTQFWNPFPLMLTWEMTKTLEIKYLLFPIFQIFLYLSRFDSLIIFFSLSPEQCLPYTPPVSLAYGGSAAFSRT